MTEADFMPAYDLVDDCYVLDDDHQVKSAKSQGLDFIQWATIQYGDGNKHVALDEFTQRGGDKITVSTVFLGMDHSHGLGAGAPLVFETMIFGHDLARVIDRYTTWDEAVEGHAKVLRQLEQA